MANQTNLFNLIRNQVVRNEVYGGDNTFSFKAFSYPSNILNWIYKQKALKIANVKRECIEGKLVQYTITYKDCWTGSPFLERAYEALKARKEYLDKKGYSEEYSHLSVTNKFLAINDKYRYELEEPNFVNNTERLDRADDCTFELFVQTMGFEDYNEYMKFREENELSEDEINARYNEFFESIKADEYEY